VPLQEDELLRQLVEQHGPKRWSQIASRFPTKCGKQVMTPHCKNSTSSSSKQDCSADFPPWLTLCLLLLQCRRRWVNHLTVDTRKGGWTEAVSLDLNFIWHQQTAQSQFQSAVPPGAAAGSSSAPVGNHSHSYIILHKPRRFVYL
jgi:hypothetical protein